MDDEPTFSEGIEQPDPWQRRAPVVLVTSPPPRTDRPRVSPSTSLATGGGSSKSKNR